MNIIEKNIKIHEISRETVKMQKMVQKKPLKLKKRRQKSLELKKISLILKNGMKNL